MPVRWPLERPRREQYKRLVRETRCTYCLDCVCHSQPGHDHTQSATAEAADGDLMLDLAESPTAPRSFLPEDADIVELLEEQSFVLPPHRVVWF